MGRKETEAAIQEDRAGNLKRFNSVDELMSDLQSDDDLDFAGQKVGAEPVNDFETPDRIYLVSNSSDFICQSAPFLVG